MKQEVMVVPGKIEFREVPVPDIGPTQALVKVIRIGICGSDIHVYHGEHPYTSYPVVQGHEMSGEIVKLGESVSGLKVGDRVTVQPQVVCGKCLPCRSGNYHICDNLKVLGFQAPGTASEYLSVDADKILRLPSDMSFELGALVEPLAVAVHALGRAGKGKIEKVLVLGAGPIGNLVAQASKAFGANEVMITDLSEYRLGVAKECGVDYVVNPNNENLLEKLNERFGKDRADLILECVGDQSTIEQAIQYARKGTDIVVVGVFGKKVTLDLGLVQDRELRLIGTLMYKRDDFVKAIELLESGMVNPGPLLSRHFPFHEYQKAYEYIDAHRERMMKVLINVDE